MEINLRSTHIRTPQHDGDYSYLILGTVTNLSKLGSHFRSVFTIHLDYSIAPNDGLRTLNAAVQHVQDTILVEDGGEQFTLESDVIASNIDDIGVEYQIRYWVSEYKKRPMVRNQIISSVMQQLKRSGMYPCHPQQHIVHEAHRNEAKTDEERRKELIQNTSFFADIDVRRFNISLSRLYRKPTMLGMWLQRGEKGMSSFYS